MRKKLRKMIRQWRFYYLHRLSAPTIAYWQTQYLRMLFDHAIRNVPFYTNLYEKAGVTEIRAIADLRTLPLTNKEMYRTTAASELVRVDLQPRTAWKKTSGSTGHPLIILTSTKMNEEFYTDFSCFRFWIENRFITPYSFQDMRVAHVNVRARPRDTHLFVTITDFENDMDETIRRIGAFKADVLASYTSILLDIARRVAADPELMPHKPRYCSCFGEMITPAMRTEIERSLQCELFDRYGGTEMGAVASECSMHDGMHIHSESAIVEILDEENNPVPAGTQGKIVLTDLLNYNMPFIRYEIGDLGRISTEPCRCGLQTPRLYLQGRYSAHLSFGNRKVHHLEFDGVLDGFMNAVLQYRIVKESERSLAVKIIPGPIYDAQTQKKILDALQKLVPAVSVRVDIVDSLPRTPRGKSAIVVDASSE